MTKSRYRNAVDFIFQFAHDSTLYWRVSARVISAVFHLGVYSITLSMRATHVPSHTNEISLWIGVHRKTLWEVNINPAINRWESVCACEKKLYNMGFIIHLTLISSLRSPFIVSVTLDAACYMDYYSFCWGPFSPPSLLMQSECFCRSPTVIPLMIHWR